jgi:hypothetical protein
MKEIKYIILYPVPVRLRSVIKLQFRFRYDKQGPRIPVPQRWIYGYGFTVT